MILGKTVTLQHRFAQIGCSQVVFAQFASLRGPLSLWQRHISDWLRGEQVSDRLAAQCSDSLQQMEKWLQWVEYTGAPKPDLSLENIQRGMATWENSQNLETMFERKES
jgi:hypothetical protein